VWKGAWASRGCPSANCATVDAGDVLACAEFAEYGDGLDGEGFWSQTMSSESSGDRLVRGGHYRPIVRGFTPAAASDQCLRFESSASALAAAYQGARAALSRWVPAVTLPLTGRRGAGWRALLYPLPVGSGFRS
jgi:hypothetical protein